jgi:hypothetical protein
MAIDPELQNDDGTWKKGHIKVPGSGMQKGQKRLSFRQLINNIKTDHNKEELIENLWQMALSKDENIAIRATKILMETSDGKALQQLEITSNLSTEEQMQLIKDIVKNKLEEKDNE